MMGDRFTKSEFNRAVFNLMAVPAISEYNKRITEKNVCEKSEVER